MTDKQKRGLYFAKRDQNGEVIIPDVAEVAMEEDRELTLKEQIEIVENTAKSLGIAQAEVEKAKAALRAKYAKE